MDSFRLSMIENMQNMVDKSLGKRVKVGSNVASDSKTVAPQTRSINEHPAPSHSSSSPPFEENRKL
jgi:hypothetical protein